jgi:hypothetical protein
MMGFSANATGGPRMCFNAHKHWILGWFNDRQLQIDPDSNPFQGRLLAFTDAGIALAGIWSLFNSATCTFSTIEPNL